MTSHDTTQIEAALRERESGLEQQRQRGAPGSRWGLWLTIALMAVAWRHTFYEMFLRWYPGWDGRLSNQNLTFMRRFTVGDSYYSHGPLVPLTCLLMAWFIYKRIGAPASRSRSSAVVGWTVLALSLLLHLASVYARVMFASGFAFIGVVGALVLLWGGWALLRAYGLPVLFLVFMVPLPEVMIAGLNFQLKQVAGAAALWLTNNLFGIPAVMDGSKVFLPAGPDGVPKMLMIENVCSGLRSLISLIWFASLFAVVCRARSWWRLFMLLMAVPVAIACNIVRITVLNVGAHYWGVDAASEGAALHDLSGLLVFALALAMLFGIEALIVAVGRWLNRPWSDRRLMGYLESVRGAAGESVHFFKPGVIATMLLVAGLSVLWSRASVAMNQSDYARKAVPAQITIDGVTYGSTDYELDQASLLVLETNDYVYRVYEAQPGLSEPGRVGPVAARRRFELLIVFSPDNRKGTHPPDVCIEGGGTSITSKLYHRIDVETIGPMRMKELIAQNGPNATLFTYVYKCGDSYTPSFWVQQATIFLNGLRQRNAAGALIRFSLPVEGGGLDLAAARDMSLDAARALMPIIHQNLR